MNDKDQLFRFIFNQLDIRGELITLDSSWKKIVARYPYPQNVQQQLGEAMAAVAILSSTIKFEGSLILQIQSEGPLSTLVTQASNDGKLRGLAKWKQDVPVGSLAEVYGKGRMIITAMSMQGEPYQSIVPLEGNTLSDALEHYLLHSEQLQSRFWLFVNKDKVAGLFLQELPTQTGTKIQKESDWERLSILTDTITAEELFNLSAEDILHRLYHEEQVKLYEPELFQFECSCSKQKIESSLIAMGHADLIEILQDKGKIEVDCEFCNQHYNFMPADIDQLFSESKKESSGIEQSPVLH